MAPADSYALWAIAVGSLSPEKRKGLFSAFGATWAASSVNRASREKWYRIVGSVAVSFGIAIPKPPYFGEVRNPPERIIRCPPLEVRGGGVAGAQYRHPQTAKRSFAYVTFQRGLWELG